MHYVDTGASAPEMLPNHCRSVPRKKSSRGTPIAERARLRTPVMCPLGVERDCKEIATGFGEAKASEAARASSARTVVVTARGILCAERGRQYNAGKPRENEVGPL